MTMQPAAATGRTAIVTGATAGIGRALAEALAAAGATVAIVARDADRGEAAHQEITAVTGNHDIRMFKADLGSMAEVRGLAGEINAAFERIDVLVNVAGIFVPRRTETADGLEAMFATNHLAPFLLTNLLVERLTAAPSARVLTLAAPSTVKLDFADLQGERRFRALMAFGASKAANLIFTFELARRLDGIGVSANAVHPGLARTGLMRGAPAPLRWGIWLASRSPQRVAAAIAPLALSPTYAGLTGRFYLRGREIDPPSYTRDPEVGRRLWEVSAQLTGIPSVQRPTS